jgi:hypothetical protein
VTPSIAPNSSAWCESGGAENKIYSNARFKCCKRRRTRISAPPPAHLPTNVERHFVISWSGSCCRLIQFQTLKRTGLAWHPTSPWWLEPCLGLPRGPHLACTEAIRMRHVHPPHPPTVGTSHFMLTPFCQLFVRFFFLVFFFHPLYL